MEQRAHLDLPLLVNVRLYTARCFDGKVVAGQLHDVAVKGAKEVGTVRGLSLLNGGGEDAAEVSMGCRVVRNRELDRARLDSGVVAAD